MHCRSWSWKIDFRRTCFGWERDEEDLFYQAINSYLPSAGSDVVIWLGDQRGLFSVKTICEIVELKIMDHVTWNIPKQLQKIIPPKVVLFFVANHL